MAVRLSLLDPTPVGTGQQPGSVFEASVAIAQTAEKWGYRRVWYTEHHGTPANASSATGIVIGYIAAHTDRIRVGAGGIMLTNHAPLVIAEQFGTLETLFPGRIDLGLGRAPSGNQATLSALRRNGTASSSYPEDLLELRSFLAGNLVHNVLAVPRAAGAVPIYILGSSLYGAELAARMSLPYVFGSHFGPAALHDAIHAYRENFAPSDRLPQPYVMACVNVFAADDHDEAVAQMVDVRRQRVRDRLSHGFANPDLTEARIDAYLESRDGKSLLSMSRYSAVGTADEVGTYLSEFGAATQADELVLVHPALRVTDRIRSIELASLALHDTTSVRRTTSRPL